MRKSVDTVNHKDIAVPDSVMELVHTVMHQFRASQYRGQDDTPAAVTHMESKVLGYFGRHAGATQTDLSAHSGRDKAQLARLIKGLRERGLLSAEADEADRRNVRLRLTADGEAMLRGLRQRARKLEARALAGLEEAERTQLAEWLGRISRNLGGLG